MDQRGQTEGRKYEEERRKQRSEAANQRNERRNQQSEPGKQRSKGRRHQSGGRSRRNDFGAVLETRAVYHQGMEKIAIPFERNQTRDVMIHYTAPYAENNESVSDDVHYSDATFAYSLSPAATWKGPIGKGKIEIN